MSDKDIMISKGIQALASATLIQAAKEYCDEHTSLEEKRVILKDLKGEWMDFLTNGTAKNVAEELQRNEKGVKERININIGVN